MGQADEAAVVAGTVADPTGAMIPAAEVHLHGVDRQAAELDQRTNRTGGFSFSVPAGTYTLSVDAPGFVPYSSKALLVGSSTRLKLPVRLVVAGRAEEISINPELLGGTDLDSASALVFEGARLDLLSNDNATLQQQLNALAGGFSGSAQFLVDGFSGARLPPKSSIRSIRINSNAYSAYFDSLGFGRVEISTKPGAEKLHGLLQFTGTDQPLNARNPYALGLQPPYYQFQTEGNLNGPLGRKTSFFAADNVQLLDNNATVNAIVLNALQPAAVSEAVAAPQRTDVYSLRVDHEFSPMHFGYVRDEWTRTHASNSGIDPLVLPEAAFTANTLTNTLQLSDTKVLTAHAVNEARFQYIRTRIQQDPNSTAPSLVVQSSFQGGGSPAQVLRDNQDHYELQELFDFDHGTHSVRAGFRFRQLRNANESSANFNGQYVFPDLNAYRVTEANRIACQTAGQPCLAAASLRAAGGGASQFSVTVGSPAASLIQDDLGIFAEDDWQVTKNLSLTYGLRFESQSAIPDHSDPAPRVGFAWAVRRGKNSAPLMFLSGGYGIFYERFPAANLLQAIRQNGTREIAYFIQNPDTYPNVPVISALSTTQPTIYQVSPRLKSSYRQTVSLTATRALSHFGAVSGTFVVRHGAHGFLSRNINAPLPGTFDPSNPTGGSRPLGTAQNICQYSSDSNHNDQTFFLNTNLQLSKRLNVFGVYSAYRAYDDSATVASFPSNQYDLRADYGPTTGSHAQTLFAGMMYRLPYGVQFNPFLNAHSGAPFDITTGTDLNGDTIYNDRPAFATDLTRPSVARTAFGNFDTQPLPGQRLVPRNFGRSPGFVWLDLMVSRDIHLGPRGSAVAPTANSAPPSPAPRSERPWTLRFQVDAQNVFNHNNPGTPVGVIALQPCSAGAAAGCTPQASPYFGRSLSLASDFSPLTASNRTILLQSTFTF